MRYDNHPTWRMLEKAKVQLRDILDQIPRSSFSRNPKRDVIEDAHRAIIKLQLAVENRIMREHNGNR